MFKKKKNLIGELLDFIRKKSDLNVKVEQDDVLKITQKADNQKLSINPMDIEEILHRVDIHDKDFLQINFKSMNPILITSQFIGFNPLGKKIEGLPEIVTTVDLREVYKVAFNLLHTSNEDDISWDELEKLKDMFFAIAIGGTAVGFQLHREKEEFQYLMMSNGRVVNA